MAKSLFWSIFEKGNISKALREVKTIIAVDIEAFTKKRRKYPEPRINIFEKFERYYFHDKKFC